MDYTACIPVSRNCFLFSGTSGVSSETPEKVVHILANLDQLFTLNIFLLLPPVIILWGAIRKLPTIPLMLTAIIIGIINAVVIQDFSLATALNAMLNGFNSSMFADAGLGNIPVISDVMSLVNRGGLSSMMSMVLLVLVKMVVVLFA